MHVRDLPPLRKPLHGFRQESTNWVGGTAMRGILIAASAGAWAVGMALFTLDWAGSLAPQPGYQIAPLGGLFVLPAALSGVVVGGLLSGLALPRPSEGASTTPPAELLTLQRVPGSRVSTTVRAPLGSDLRQPLRCVTEPG
jgi:hypothetical protein